MLAFASLAVTLAAVRLLIRWLAPAPGRRSVAPPDYPLIAHLTGGPRRVGLAALAAARVAGAVDALPGGTLFRYPPRHPLSDVESTVAGAFGNGRRWPHALDLDEPRAVFRAIAERAAEQGLTGALRPLPTHTLAFVGSTAAAVPLGAISWWALGALVPVYLLLVRPTRRSLQGERLVRATRTARPDLHPWQPAHWRRGTQEHAGLAVALHGVAALRQIDKLFAKRLFGAPDAPPNRFAGAPADASGCTSGCGDDGCGDGGE
ncbi:TIGR04222 domain-containing membrane protein [Asanoa siamensis]|uniref:TIGR04222 domain-containing membrane protein n=1 Tax=Asanoa siamensis TaxID=926357 RepID=A0ABQ4D3J2_9ACTN|nr:TIGR04222 domain-containing membrane protein [Asanoa siamensis]GIF78104.1 hypothetical protein Asi02nite_76220 [Asanoa siamensis]